MRLPSDSKSPRPVSRRGLQNSCDDEGMPVICPTCQDRPGAPPRRCPCVGQDLDAGSGDDQVTPAALTLAYTEALLNRGTAVDVTVSAAGWCVANPIAARCKPAATDYRRRLSSCDAEYMQVICPTGQGLMHRTI